MSTFDQIDNPNAWGYSSGDAEWYNRKQVKTIFDRPIPGYPPGGLTVANAFRHFGISPVARICFFSLSKLDVNQRWDTTCFLADGRRFTSTCDVTNTILGEMGLEWKHGDCKPNAGICMLGDKANCRSDHNRCTTGVVFQGTPLGAYTEPTVLQPVAVAAPKIARQESLFEVAS